MQTTAGMIAGVAVGVGVGGVVRTPVVAAGAAVASVVVVGTTTAVAVVVVDVEAAGLGVLLQPATSADEETVSDRAAYAIFFTTRKCRRRPRR